MALHFLTSRCLVIVIWLFLLSPWVGLQCVIVVFPDHTRLLFFNRRKVKAAYSVTMNIFRKKIFSF